ncbi:hypothetical protein B4064_1027 [Caldibacillus thermoamylovorans]|nr:hypothetical protein B4064_1027 [Caldibacillus thermoamylovorans]KIO70016.1 hypothetical protein B4166_1713 [Caldibacillus thermoamylovorans]
MIQMNIGSHEDKSFSWVLSVILVFSVKKYLSTILPLKGMCIQLVIFFTSKSVN